MMHLLMALMLGPTGSVGDTKLILRDRVREPTAVTDKDIHASRPPDCRTEADVKRAVEQVRNGEIGDCFVKDATAFNRHR
jgi:hypothetical protein